MTTLSIIANYEKKRLKCYGTVAAGEHVAVTVTDGAQWIGEGKSLRLRVLFGPNIVAVFPFAEGDAWTAAGTQDADAACELNLNTLQAEKYLKHGGTCLWILDDVENHTLYATGEFDVLPWPKRRGIDEPIDLDGYPQLVDDINELKEAWEEYKQTIEQAISAKQDIINDLPEIREGAAAGATAIQSEDIFDGDKVKSDLLPSYVDDVLEYATFSAFPATGESGKIYIALDTNKTYRWSGTQYTEIANPTFDSDVTKNSTNPVKSSGIWSALWGALTALPTGFTSLYDWCVSQLAGKKNNFDAGNGLVETSNTLYAYRGVDGTSTERELRYTVGPADVGSTVYSWNGSATIPTGETVRMVNTAGRIYTVSFPNPVYYDRSAADDIVRPNVIAIDQSVVAKKTDVPAPSTATPAVDSGVGSAGASTSYARGDHVHPTDTSRMAATATGSNIPASTGSALTIAQSLEANATAIGSIGNLAEQTAQGLSTHTGNTTIHVTATEKATWNGKQSALTAQQLANIAAVPNKANRAANPTAGNLAALDAQGNPTDSTISAANVAMKASPAVDGHVAALNSEGGIIDGGKSPIDLSHYALTTNTIRSGMVFLDDHASNSVTIPSTLSPNTLTINFPTAPSGKVRDFAMRLNISAGVTAPEIAWPQGVTLENDGGEVPEIADGGTGGSSTILYFSETENNGTTAKFLVKGETLTAITQA